MSKPGFPIAGPYPSLRAELPFHDPRECAECGSGKGLQVWQECDTGDAPTAIYLVLCERCSAKILDAHPRLYVLLEPNCPAPGVMPICLNCVHRAGSLCWHPRSWARGHRDLKLEYPSPTTAIFRHAKRKDGSRTSVTKIFPGQVYNCSGKELVPNALAYLE